LVAPWLLRPTNRDGPNGQGFDPSRRVEVLLTRHLGPPQTTKGNVNADTNSAQWPFTDHRHAGGGGVIQRARRRRRSPVFNTWLAVLKRGPVCERWHSFGNFYRDVHPKPTWRHLLVRDDTSRPFSPDNARWRSTAR
jgi:hypothetical protein